VAHIFFSVSVAEHVHGLKVIANEVEVRL